MLLLLLAVATATQQQETNDWFDTLLQEREAPDWITSYLTDVDGKISDSAAHTYFRQFLADSNTRLADLKRFVEYLTLAGYPQTDLANTNEVPSQDIYKAVYFAHTYTIIDALPSGPQNEHPSNTQ